MNSANYNRMLLLPIFSRIHAFLIFVHTNKKERRILMARSSEQVSNCHRGSGSKNTGKPEEVRTSFPKEVEPLPESTRPRKDGPGGD